MRGMLASLLAGLALAGPAPALAADDNRRADRPGPGRKPAGGRARAPAPREGAGILPVLSPGLPAIPHLGSRVEDFIPEGWKVLGRAGRAEGDLDGDGLPDAALVLAPFSEKPSSLEPRLLLLVLRDAKGGWRLSAASNSAVRCASCGGLAGNPFQGVAIASRTLTVSHEGGSAWRWRQEDSFRPRGGDWVLARQAKLELRPANENSLRTADCDLSAGVVVKRSTGKDCKPRRRRQDKLKPPKVRLVAFDPEAWKACAVPETADADIPEACPLPAPAPASKQGGAPAAKKGGVAPAKRSAAPPARRGGVPSTRPSGATKAKAKSGPKSTP